MPSFFKKVLSWFRPAETGTKQAVGEIPAKERPTPSGPQRPPRTGGRPGQQSPQHRPGRHTHGVTARPPVRRKEIPSVAPVPVPRWDISKFHVPTVVGKTRFHDLDLPPEILHAIADLDFQYCTPVQAAILPKTLTGQDATGKAQTGTGKTAAFLITILAHFLRKPVPPHRRHGTPRALIMAPTRELVMQIEKDARLLSQYVPCNILSVFGGMDYEKQKHELTNQMADIVVATPGRLLDYKRKGHLHLSQVEIMVIDEADRMLDMGFIPDMRRIIESTPPKAKRQTMLFSATLTPEVLRLASAWTKDPAMVEIAPEHVTVDAIDQIVYITTNDEKFALLYNIITQQKLERVLVFCNRRDVAQMLKDQLTSHAISSGLLSGDIDQRKRIVTLEAFREGKIRVLVATDVAARGLHIEAISHVINYNLPQDPEDYIHRIGRTGRAGATGTSVSFATEDDSYSIPDIEKLLGRKLPCVYPAEGWTTPPPPPTVEVTRTRRPQRPRSGHQRPRRGGRPNSSRGSR